MVEQDEKEGFRGRLNFIFGVGMDGRCGGGGRY